IDMRHIIADRKRIEFAERERLLFAVTVFDVELVIALKNLVVGVACDTNPVVDKSLEKRENDRLIVMFEMCRFVNRFKNLGETCRLTFIRTKKIIGDSV